ncbi:HPr family phosphocarrier protein [Clostridium rectalis]|nr:HPr family phosphocarrier protein [Clostridium rectalis]
MSCTKGDEIIIKSEENDEKEAINQIVDLIENRIK